MGKAIGNGETTSVWKDFWISLDKDTRPYGPIPEAALDITVSDLLTSDMKWNKARMEEILPLVAKEVQMLQPGDKESADIYVWQPLQSGIYTTRSGYFAAAMEDVQINPVTNNEFDWRKDIWTEKTSPKLKLFLWSIVQNALPLGENLQKRGIHSDITCIRCKGFESATHIFSECPFAKKVWELIPLQRRIHLGQGDGFIDTMIKYRRATCLPP